MTFSVVFPGQGSQSVGMLADLSAEFPVVGASFAECADVLGKDLWALAQSGPAEACLLYTSPSPRDLSTSRMPSSA